MPGAVRNGAKIGFPGAKVGISGGFCLVLGAEGCFLFGFPEIVATFAIATENQISLSIFSAVCIFTRKIDDCPVYGGFCPGNSADNNGRDVGFW